MSHRPRFRSLSLASAVFFACGAAAAQTGGPDMNIATPNVLLLVDTSGSMEWKSGTRTPPTCVPDSENTGASTDQNEKSRWIELVEVLTGTIRHYSCFSQPRNTTAFADEFSIVSGATTYRPLDYRYIDDYHRPLSAKCAPGPGDLPANPWEWPAQPVKYRQYSGGSVLLNTFCGGYQQANDGILDAFSGQVRFGLMTFDTEVDPGTGVSSPNPDYGVVRGSPDYASGIQGAWSYYLPSAAGCKRTVGAGKCVSRYSNGLQSVNPDGCCAGGPTVCPELMPQEVGARNVSAPPWEGRMVAFGPSAEDGVQRANHIQQVLLATRPYGGTPIAGMLHDAQDFFWRDLTKDPLNPTVGFGPMGDAQVTSGCRDNFVVLLTDGEPNLDLRTACEGTTDNCPFDRPEQIADQMMRPSDSTKPKVRTFVVGFALDSVNVSGTPTSCAEIPVNSPACANATGALATCCRLNAIAYAGTPTLDQASSNPGVIKAALFPKNATELRDKLNQALSSTLGTTATRTYPVSTSAPLADTTAAGYQFTSGTGIGRITEDPSAGVVRRGVLNRSRVVCSGTPVAPTPQTVSQADGDDFAANLASNPTSRTLFTVAAPSGVATWNGSWSVRPYFETSLEDGVMHGTGLPTRFVPPTDLKTEISAISLGVSAATCGTATASACANRLVDWYAGVPSATPSTRCPVTDSDRCQVLGDILHSVPVVRPGIPSDFLRDPTYSTFSAGLRQRDTALYTASLDGVFHAFLVYPGKDVNARRVTTKKPNELFGFIPPAVLPFVSTMYSGTNSRMNFVPALDGAPVVADVGATQGGTRALNTSTGTTLYYPYRLERKGSADTGEVHTYRTVSLQSFGPKQPGYFALDVTSPLVEAGDSASGPRFLWQLTTDDTGKRLFGAGNPTPAIATLFVNLQNLGVSSGVTTREVAVAILPGGLGDTAPAAGSCGPGPSATIQPVTNGPSGSSFTRQTRCYNNSQANIAARSLTIVRLDTGQILRTFRPTLPTGTTAPTPTFAAGVVTTQEIPAPIVGSPAAYPGRPGQVSDRIFVGDAEGRVWRVNVSSRDPAEWTMQVFYDSYFDAGSTGAVPQPLELPPTLSVDGRGQIVVAVSTGSQENLSYDTIKNYTSSVTEYIATNSSGAKEFWSQINWRKEFSNGERALGPMTIFDRILYFSTFVPAQGNTCAKQSNVWGMDYLTPATDVPSGGKIPPGPSGSPLYPLPITGIVAGVGVQQLPSCQSGLAATDSVDEFLGYGKTTTTTSMTPGSFELVIQKSGLNPSGIALPKTITTEKMTVATPKVPVRIDSWAPILE